MNLKIDELKPKENFVLSGEDPEARCDIRYLALILASVRKDVQRLERIVAELEKSRKTNG